MIFSKIVLASNNAGKLNEFSALFAPLGIEIIPQKNLHVPEVEEPFFTFLENALHKARHASRHTGLPALADDSGICVKALENKPGVFSARFAGAQKSDTDNNIKLINELKNHTERSACYYCTLVLVQNPNDPIPIIGDGFFYGEIIDTPRGSNGFGYDPYFYLPQYKQTVAELSPTIKNRISHRGQALNMLMDKLEKLE